MEPTDAAVGEVIITQGAPGTHFFIVQSGKYDVLLKQNGHVPVHAYGRRRLTHGPPARHCTLCSLHGVCVCVYVLLCAVPHGHMDMYMHMCTCGHRYDEGGFFGELALLYDKPRAATIKCATAGVLHRLDRDTFMEIVT